MITPLPKIYALGTKETENIFEGVIEVTEKIDGSQFIFGKIDGSLRMRSKGVMLTHGHMMAGGNMFITAMNYAQDIIDKLPDNVVFYCEYLQKPKHNCLGYERVPKNNLMLLAAKEYCGTTSLGSLFSVGGGTGGTQDTIVTFTRQHLLELANQLDIELVPLLDLRTVGINNEQLSVLLNNISVLGNEKIEGVVIHNVTSGLRAKYVSERFKERHGAGKIKTDNLTWEKFANSFYKNEARWNKAVQHLRDKGQLLGEPKDIGALIKEVKADIIEEHYSEIKEALHKFFVSPLLAKSTHGLAEYYKDKLAADYFEKEYEKGNI
jgi:hypothetical protein